MTDKKLTEFPRESKCNDCTACVEGKCAIKPTKTEIDSLKYTLLGVMHFVDKWLDENELEQDEVNRADTMRHKTLQIIEEQQAEIERLKAAKPEAIKEFADKLKQELEGEYIKATNKLENAQNIVVSTNIKIVDNLVKEMVGGEVV